MREGRERSELKIYLGLLSQECVCYTTNIVLDVARFFKQPQWECYEIFKRMEVGKDINDIGGFSKLTFNDSAMQQGRENLVDTNCVKVFHAL